MGFFPVPSTSSSAVRLLVYDERRENKAVNHQALQSYWLEEVNPGGCVYSLPRTRRKLTLLQDGGA
ncbi:MAG: hypothetical protein ACK53Y_12390 [bacterium]